MIIKIVYNSDYKSQFDFYYDLINKLHDITIESYDTRYTADAKKGIKIRGAFGARLEPFVGIYSDEGKILKGFYTEVLECKVDNIINYLNNYESNDE